jgi:hypothetical protein
MSERRGGAEHRRKLLAQLSGRVIEIEAGSGANFAHYPTTVSEVVAVEPERYLRERAKRAAADAPVPSPSWREIALIGVLICIHVEEAALSDALGEDYTEYASKTRRLLPGVW